MRATVPDARYTRTAMILHWVIALLVIVQFAWGWWMQQIPKQPTGPRVDAFNAHKSVGLLILALMVVRILWWLAHRPPALPAMPAWQARIARATHALLYILLLLQPLTGYLGSEVSGYPVRFFGVVLPSWAGKHVALKDSLSTMHLLISWLIGAAVALHIAGALKHAWIDRDRIGARMGLPGRTTRPARPSAIR